MLSRLAAFVAAAAACVACSAPRDTGHAPLLIAHEADLSSLDPLAATDAITKSVLSNVYDTLADFDTDMRLVPSLASSWTNPDSQTWILTLRQGVRTHDGILLTGDDVKFSLDRARTDPASSVADRLATIEDIEVGGDFVVLIRTREPDPLLMRRLDDIFIAPRRTALTLRQRPVGTGPYRFVRSSGGTLELEAFADHWRGAPPLKRVQFTTVKAGEATLEALRDRKADVLRWVPEALVDRLKMMPEIRVVSHPSLRVLYLWLNSQREAGRSSPLADRRVRQALSLALDREGLVARIGGRSRPATQFVPPGVFGHLPTLSGLAYDPDAARRLLREAGYPRGFDLTLAYAAGAEPVAEVMRSMWQDVGVRVAFEAREWPDLLAAWRAAHAPPFIGSWLFSSGELSMFLKECLFTRDPNVSSGWNPGYSNPRLDELISLNYRTFGEPARLEQSETLMKLLLEEMPLVPLFSREDLYAVRSDVKWRPRFDGKLRAAEMEWAADN